MRPLLVDTNLLVLLVVGLASKELIEKHRRLREYSLDDFDLLAQIVRGHSHLITTPNIWTEVSNLARQTSEPARSKIALVMRQLMAKSNESYVRSIGASKAVEFARLGLADCAILEVEPASVAILTSDLDLYLAAITRGREATNFNHVREANRS